MAKPYLLLQIRPEDDTSDNEYQAFLRSGGLSEPELERRRIEHNGIGSVNLDDYSGIILGGGPADISESEAKKSKRQRLFEADLSQLITRVVDADFPFLGDCYGMGSLASNTGGVVSKEKYSEAVGAVNIELTDEAADDPITCGLPKTFRAFTGHKEAVQQLPPAATVLARSATCPVQMIRIKNNVYATQFHPEVTNRDLALRVLTYSEHGYFNPEDSEKLVSKIKVERVTEPQKIIKQFVRRYRKS